MANKDAIVTLKVLLQATGSVKAMRFGLDLSVGEVIKEIRVKNEIGGKDHGLFVPPNPETGKKAFWLAKNRTLRYYGLINNVRPASPPRPTLSPPDPLGDGRVQEDSPPAAHLACG